MTRDEWRRKCDENLLRCTYPVVAGYLNERECGELFIW